MFKSEPLPDSAPASIVSNIIMPTPTHSPGLLRTTTNPSPRPSVTNPSPNTPPSSDTGGPIEHNGDTSWGESLMHDVLGVSFVHHVVSCERTWKSSADCIQLLSASLRSPSATFSLPQLPRRTKRRNMPITTGKNKDWMSRYHRVIRPPLHRWRNA